jgi:hypothetical protein
LNALLLTNNSLNQNDLDFDLHFNANDNILSSSNENAYKTSSIPFKSHNSKSLEVTNNQSKKLHSKTSHTSSVGQVLFKDDEDDDEDEIDEIFIDDSDDSGSIGDESNDTSVARIPPPRMSLTKNKIIDINNNNLNLFKSDNDRSRSSILTTKINFSKRQSSEESFSPTSSNFIGGFTPNLTDSTPQNSVITKSVNMSRTRMKMQLMKQQTEEIEKREIEKSIPKAVNNQDNLMNLIGGTSSSYRSNSDIQFSYNNSMSNNNFELSTDSYLKSATDPSTATIIRNNQNADSIGDFRLNAGNESSTMLLPSSLTSSEIIPRNVLAPVYQNEIKLDYPTKYHVMQIAKNLQQSTILPNQLANKNKKTKISSPKPKASNKATLLQRQILIQREQQQNIAIANTSDNSLTSSAEISILPNGSSGISDNYLQRHSFESEGSNFDPIKLSSPASSSFSQNEVIDEELEDFMTEELNNFINKRSLSIDLTNEEMQEEINQMERCLNLPKTLPNSSFIKIGSPAPFKDHSQASSSCPSDIARLKKLQGLRLTDDEIRLIVKDRQKKDTHNMIERRRRFNINDRIKELGTILPKSNSQSEIKQNKGSILKASVDYIKNLQSELNQTKEFSEKFRQMTLLNHKLMSRIKELESQKVVSQTHDPGNAVSTNQIKQEPSIDLFAPPSAYNQVSANNRENTFNQPSQNNFNNQPMLNLNQIQQPHVTENFANFNQTTDDLLNDVQSLEEILSHHDPLLGNSILYSENFMESSYG